MNNSLKYNIFILISTIARSLVEVFSLVFLYKMGYGIKDILFFLVIMYSVGIISNSLGIYLAIKIGYRYVLIISSLLYGFGYYYLSVMDSSKFNLILFAIIMSFGNYMYHVIRHYVAIMIRDINVSSILIWNYIGIMVTSLIGAYITNKLSLFICVMLVIFLSLVALIPISRLRCDIKEEINFSNVSLKNKKVFFVMEQFKVIFCELQGLFLFLYVESDLIYIGIFQLFIGITSILFLFYFSRFSNNYKCFKYFNILLVIVLFLKVNLDNKYLLYLFGFFEGLFFKEFEYFSTLNLYDIGNNNKCGYLVLSEIIFSGSKSIFMFVFYLFFDNLYWIMLVCIMGIFICGFIYPKNREVF